MNINRKILHVGNILNNGYINCKYLRRRGIEADLLTVGYKHVQGQPEWEDVYIDQPVSEWGQDWSKIDLGGYIRPGWVHDVFINEIPGLVSRLQASATNESTKIKIQADKFTPQTKVFLEHVIPKGVKLAKRLGLQRLISLVKSKKTLSLAKAAGITPDNLNKQIEVFKKEFKSAYPNAKEPLTDDDIHVFLSRSLALAPVFKLYPLVQAYALDPIYVMLGDPGKPFICFEHGTMREFPFENSACGRLYALSLKKAERVIITNADCNRSAERLGLNNYTFIPHPIDEEIYSPGESKVKERLFRQYKCEMIFVAPARHHWKHCPPGLENSWFKRNDILIRALGNIFKKNHEINALVVFFEWGQEVKFSKELIEEYGFSNKVHWEPIRSKRVMKDFYNAADIVFDQFNAGIGTFGGVVPEAMACAKPVLLNYKEELHRWCYPVLPPIFNTPDEDAIEKCTLNLIQNHQYRYEIGEKGREWFLKYHSSRVVTDRLVDIYRAASDKYCWGWEF